MFSKKSNPLSWAQEIEESVKKNNEEFIKTNPKVKITDRVSKDFTRIDYVVQTLDLPYMSYAGTCLYCYQTRKIFSTLEAARKYAKEIEPLVRRQSQEYSIEG